MKEYTYKIEDIMGVYYPKDKPEHHWFNAQLAVAHLMIAS